MRVDESLERCPQGCGFAELRLKEVEYFDGSGKRVPIIVGNRWEVHCAHEGVCSIRNEVKEWENGEG